LAPTVALSDGYLFIATTETIIQEALAVKSGQTPGLKSTGEFQRLAKGTPQQGNSFSFISRRFGETFGQIQKQALAKAANTPTGASKQWMQSLVGSGPASFAYTVAGNTDEGWLTVANGNQHPAKLFLVSAIVPVAMVSAIALPAFAKAKSKAQKVACINNLRQIADAKQQWALENKKADTDTPTKTDLLPFLKNQQFPVCPGKGDYTINPFSTPPQCSLPGHSLAEQ
jgi:general secretion pathway protein G